MAGVQDLFKNSSVQMIAIGVGAAILAPILLPAVAAIAKPVARAAIKAGIITYEKGKEAVAEVGEVLEDLVAEAKAELEQSSHAVPAPPTQAVEQATKSAMGEPPAG